MSRRLLVALVVVGLTGSACGSKQERSTPRHAPHESSKRVATVARDVVDRGVDVAWSTAAAGVPAAVAADRRGEVVVVDHERVGALDPNGRVLWVMNSDEVVNAVPALMGDRVVVPFTRANGAGGCLGLDRATGEIRWRYEAIITGGVAVAAANGVALCVMHNGQTAGISPSFGGALWEFTFQGDVDSSTIEVPAGTSIAVDAANDDFAFVARLGAQWQMTTRSIRTGHTRAFLPLGSAGSPSAPMLVASGFFGVASGEGGFCIASADRAESDLIPVSVRNGFDPASVPIRVGDNVIVFGRAGEVIALDIGSGTPRWTAHTTSALRTVHAIVLGHELMLQTWSGRLVAFRLTDGSSVRLPWKPAQAIGMLFSGGPGAAIAVGQDGDDGWIERWEPKPGH